MRRRWRATRSGHHRSCRAARRGRGEPAQVTSLIEEINRKWPFERDTKIKLHEEPGCSSRRERSRRQHASLGVLQRSSWQLIFVSRSKGHLRLISSISDVTLRRLASTSARQRGKIGGGRLRVARHRLRHRLGCRPPASGSRAPRRGSRSPALPPSASRPPRRPPEHPLVVFDQHRVQLERHAAQRGKQRIGAVDRLKQLLRVVFAPRAARGSPACPPCAR